MSDESPQASAPLTADDFGPHDGFTLWAVFRRDPASPVFFDGAEVGDVVGELDDALLTLTEQGVQVRGLYDVSGLRADADLMVWIHGAAPETLQWSIRQLRRTRMLNQLLPMWNAMGVHREAEFNARHLPSFMQGKAPLQWVTVYPFVRSYEWYLLPDEERRAMLADHGRKGGAHRTVLPNTVASFALGDYEWILGLEADELVDLVDLMRDLRATDARRHVREEVPFYTGRRVTTAEVVEILQ